MSFKIIFIDEESKFLYQQGVLSWLRLDYVQKGRPSKHFWHNREHIKEAFSDGNVMVVLNQESEIVSFMTYEIIREILARIDIVEVKESYRRQGIFKMMLEDFLRKFTELYFMFAHVLPQAMTVFDHMSWQKQKELHSATRYYRILKPTLMSQDTLPREGRVIAIYSKENEPPASTRYVDFFQVRERPAEFQKKYFLVDLDSEGYVGIYLDGRLIVEGKPKYLFRERVDCTSIDMLVVKRLTADDFNEPRALQEEGFFTDSASRKLPHESDEEEAGKQLRM